MLRTLLMLMQIQWLRLRALRDDDRGMTTEAIIITASLAALAIAALIVIRDGVMGEANEIDFDAPTP